MHIIEVPQYIFLVVRGNEYFEPCYRKPAYLSRPWSVVLDPIRVVGPDEVKNFSRINKGVATPNSSLSLKRNKDYFKILHYTKTAFMLFYLSQDIRAVSSVAITRSYFKYTSQRIAKHSPRNTRTSSGKYMATHLSQFRASKSLARILLTRQRYKIQRIAKYSPTDT